MVKQDNPQNNENVQEAEVHYSFIYYLFIY